jgi:hypothetical protein
MTISPLPNEKYRASVFFRIIQSINGYTSSMNMSEPFYPDETTLAITSENYMQVFHNIKYNEFDPYCYWDVPNDGSLYMLELYIYDDYFKLSSNLTYGLRDLSNISEENLRELSGRCLLEGDGSDWEDLLQVALHSVKNDVKILELCPYADHVLFDENNRPYLRGSAIDIKRKSNIKI